MPRIEDFNPETAKQILPRLIPRANPGFISDPNATVSLDPFKGLVNAGVPMSAQSYGQFDSPESRAAQAMRLPPAVPDTQATVPQPKGQSKLSTLAQIAKIIAGAAQGAQLGPAQTLELQRQNAIQDQQIERQRQLDERQAQMDELNKQHIQQQIQAQRLASDPQYQMYVRAIESNREMDKYDRQKRIDAQYDISREEQKQEIAKKNYRPKDFWDAMLNAATPEEQDKLIEIKKRAETDKNVQLYGTEQGVMQVKPDGTLEPKVDSKTGKPIMPFRNPTVQINPTNQALGELDALVALGMDRAEAQKLLAAKRAGVTPEKTPPPDLTLTDRDIAIVERKTDQAALRDLVKKYGEKEVSPDDPSVLPDKYWDEFTALRKQYKPAITEERLRDKNPTRTFGTTSTSTTVTTPTTSPSKAPTSTHGKPESTTPTSTTTTNPSDALKNIRNIFNAGANEADAINKKASKK